MNQDVSNKDPGKTEETELQKKDTNFTAEPDKGTQDAIIRNLYIPKILRDKIKKPDSKRER